MELATRSLASGSALPNILKVQNRTGNIYRSGYQSSVQLYDCGGSSSYKIPRWIAAVHRTLDDELQTLVFQGAQACAVQDSLRATLS